MDTVNMVLNLLFLVGVAVLVLFVKVFLPSYIKQKGANLATKEDIAEITGKIESVKHEYARDLEKLRTGLGSQLHVHRTRYEKEFQVLVDLSEKVVELRDATMNLRPVSDYGPPEGKEEEWRRARLSRYQAAAQDLYKTSEKFRPFYPENIYEVASKLNDIAWGEAAQYRAASREAGRKQDAAYWDEAQKNSQAIQSASAKVIALIRARAQRWEKLESE